jgi:NAD(P)-dependent dehydrogenase (short-subunit alcohol dehydrogenase family)
LSLKFLIISLIFFISIPAMAIALRTLQREIMATKPTSKVWLITGAGRGLGLDIAKAALAAAHKVVARGRNPDKVAKAIGSSSNLLVVKLDIMKSEHAVSAIQETSKRLGRIDGC